MINRKHINEVIFEQVREEFQDIDTGPSGIYQQILHHITNGMEEVATQLAYHAMEVSEEMIEHTDTERFLEVFRRTSFCKLHHGVYSSSAYEAYREAMESTREYLVTLANAARGTDNGGN